MNTRVVTLVALALLLAEGLDAARAEAQDEPFVVSADALAAVPLGAPQSDRFQPGFAVSLSVARPLVPWLALGVRGRGGMLFDGPAPTDAGQVDPGVGTWLGALVTVRVRPLPFLDPDRRATGLFLEGGAGAGLTGALIRPLFEGAIGWGFAVDDVVLAPTVRYAQMVDLDSSPSPGDARLLMAGLELAFNDRVARPAAPPVEDPVQEEAPGDRDGDGLVDPLDHCPDEPEDADGFEDLDGCPEPDDDHDGILDQADACPRVPEDLDGLDDEDGCPEDDVDHDSIRDQADACPREPETLNAVDDSDGCPDEGLITMLEDRVVLEDRVLFETASARVRHAARPILEALVALWREHPDWIAMRIEGHADLRGTDEANLQLSQRRALQVRAFLAELGLPEDTLQTAAYGESRPLVDGYSEDAHARNRRVEFVVVRRTPSDPEAAAAPTPPAAGPELMAATGGQ